MEVLCISSYLNYILAGIGNRLYVYSNQVLNTSKQIFIDERIHNIYIKNDRIFVKGGRQLALVFLNQISSNVLCKIFSIIQSKDWIQDVVVYKDTVGITTAHNDFEIWNMILGKCVKIYFCEEKCILYSCKIIGNSLEDTLVFSGTVFGDVLIWAPYLNEGESLVKKFNGHNGAIFSLEVNIQQKILATTSDDRSLRIWSIKSKESLSCVKFWQNFEIELIHILYGHTGRVWRSLIVLNYYVTIGEDSKLIIWSKDGRLLKSLTIHQESGIRALHYFENKIITGGEDGGINSLYWDHLVCENSYSILERSISVGKNFSSKVCFFKNGFVYTTNGGVKMVSEELEEVIYKNENFQNYCILEVSTSENLIIMGSIKGHLVIIDPISKNVLVEDQPFNGRVCSVHSLDDYILTSGPNGSLKLWQLLSKILVFVKEMELPNCQERWTTCASICKDKIIVGDRMGNIYVYDMNGGKLPIQSFRKIHSYLGVTDIVKNNNTILSVGRDGSVKQFSEDMLYFVTYKLPIEWPCQILKYKNDLLILGFSSASFVVWSMKYREIIASHNCGGGHRSYDCKLKGDKLIFLYLKGKKIFLVNLILDSIVRLRNGFHAKEINCLEVIQAKTTFFFTGSEDTTLRINRVTNSELEEIDVLKTHISSIRAIGLCLMNENKYLVVSAGGRAQIIVWFYDLITLRCYEIANYFVRKEVKNRKYATTVIDPETRFMCISVVKLKNEYFIAAGCSDCQIRLFTYNSEFKPLCSILYTHCILKVAILKTKFLLFIASMGTDGLINFWNVTDITRVLKIGSFTLHQSGINCFYFEEVEPEKFVLATGGDDNLVSLCIVHISEKKVFLRQVWKNNTTHSCQVTGCNILKNILLTTSIDQRITLWKWSLKDNDNISVKFIKQYVTTVPDIQGIKSTWLDDTTILILIHGKGMESLKVDVSALNRDKAHFIDLFEDWNSETQAKY